MKSSSKVNDEPRSTVGIPIPCTAEAGLTLVCLRCNHAWLRRSLARAPGTCPRCCSPYWNRPRKGEEASQPRQPTLSRPPVLQPRPLTRAEGLQAASDVISELRGYRKNFDYRTIQNDLNFICAVLQRVSVGETNNIARPIEC